MILIPTIALILVILFSVLFKKIKSTDLIIILSIISFVITLLYSNQIVKEEVHNTELLCVKL